jgi:crotonobetainyl-CoA:carnitine CoA-transferase CaiB-like acyl-CoA transferase
MKVLEGVKVIEIGRFITAPLAAQLLAELGADVLKVESPNAVDPFRTFDGGTYSAHFQSHNRNKRSLVLDFGTPAGGDVLKRLLREADVLVLNMRPGSERKLGLDADTVRQLNSRLIYCAITGFGADGPYAHRPAFDNVGQALSGWLSMFHRGADPRVPGPPVSDTVTGLYASIGILGALVARGETGLGRKVEVSMLEAMIALATEPLGQLSAHGEAPPFFSRASKSQSYVVTCACGSRIGLHLSSPEKFWLNLLNAIERPDLAEKFPDRASRVAGYDVIAEELTAVFRSRTREEWMQRLEEHDVPAAPERRLDELRDDEQVQHLGVFFEFHHPAYGAIRAANRAIRYDGDNNSAFCPPPAFGEHSIAVLREAGLSDQEIDGLRDQRIVIAAQDQVP